MTRRCSGRAPRSNDPSTRDFGGFGQRAQVSASRQHRTLPAALVRHIRRDRSGPQAVVHGDLTLTRMAEGGIYDQLGGGFSRYSVDGSWMIPHFEKMLYDNGQLLCEYARAGAGHRRSLVCADRRRNRGLGAARHALSRRRLLLQPRCGFRGPRGQVLCLDPRRGRRHC